MTTNQHSPPPKNFLSPINTMKSKHPSDPAFVGTKGTFLLTSTKARICARDRRRNRSPPKWRCIVQEGPAEKAKDISQIEGAVPFDKFDAGLEAALSKGWDKLDNFDTSMVDAEVDQTITSDSEDDETITADLEDESVPNSAQTTNVLPTDSDPSITGDPADPMVLESSSGEDQPSSATLDAKPKTKPKTKRRRSTAKRRPQEKKPMTELELKESVEWSTEPRWYFVQVKPGCEQSTAASIRNLSTSLETSDIREVLVPTTTIMRLTKGGKSVKKEERFFPSYILVLMTMNRRNYSEILAVPNVQFFMGDPNRDKKKDAPLRPPLPVKDAEMKNVFERIEEAQSAKPEIKTTIRPGDSIKVISGTFTDNIGTVLEVKPDLNVVRTSLHMFGRETAVDLEFNQVEVVDLPTVPEAKTDEVETEIPEENMKLDVRGKSIPGGARRNAGVASHEDDLASLLEDTEDEESERTEDYDADESDVELTQSEDNDGFGEAEIIGDHEVGEFSSAKIDDEESEGSTVSIDPVAKETNGLISSDDQLADLLSDDHSTSSEWDSDLDSESKESDGLNDLDEFFSSLDELDEEADKSDGDDSILSDTDSVAEEMTRNHHERRVVSNEELMRRMEAPISNLDDEDDLGFSAKSILADVDDMMAEVAAGKRKVGPQEEDHDLSKSLIETAEEIPEIDLFAMPDLEGHNDPDTTADPAPQKM